MTTANDNLQTAFAGESQANRRYLFYAERADDEGYKQVARLFRAAAEAETVHARNHLRVMAGVQSTSENLQTAVAGENHEFTEMYPGFIREAELAGQSQARRSFDLANKVEQIHHGLFQSALARLERGDGIDEKPFFVCQVCGNTVDGEAPERCPVCGAPRSRFKQVD